MYNEETAKAIEKIAKEVPEKIEEGVVSTYKKIEKGAVDGFNKVADGFVDIFFTKEGETVEEAKARMLANTKEAAAAARKKAGLED